MTALILTLVVLQAPLPAPPVLLVGSQDGFARLPVEVCWQEAWGTANARRCMAIGTLVDILATVGLYRQGVEPDGVGTAIEVQVQP